MFYFVSTIHTSPFSAAERISKTSVLKRKIKNIDGSEIIKSGIHGVFPGRIGFVIYSNERNILDSVDHIVMDSLGYYHLYSDETVPGSIESLKRLMDEETIIEKIKYKDQELYYDNRYGAVLTIVIRD